MVTEACDGLGNETTFTWQAWEAVVPETESAYHSLVASLKGEKIHG